MMRLPALAAPRRPALVFAFLLILSSCAALSIKTEGGIWPHDGSDLKPDPSLTFGRLENGARYILKHNQEPKGRVALYLLVGAGSMYENDSQQGIAHFLEHMVFNGSENFPSGEMVKYFQSIGMSFGPDANAYTGYDRTVYNVLLPDNSPGGLDKGLVVLRDYAAGALLEQKEIERERGVVLAEMSSRDSPGYRTFKAAMEFQLPGALPALRMPIGKEEVLRAADQKLVRGFYNDWYRPDLLVVSVVGDTDMSLAEQLVKKHFASLARRGAALSKPDPGKVSHKGIRFFHHYEKEEGDSEAAIGAVWNVPPQKDTLAWRKELVLRELANAVVRNRLNALLEKPGAPFTGADIGSGIFLDTIAYAEISADTSPETWEKSLAAIEQTLRAALLHGFSKAETERVKQDFLAALKKAAAQEPTRDSPGLAHAFVSATGDNAVILSPAQELELMAPVIESADPASLLAALRRTWPDSHRLVSVTGNADLAKQGAPQDLLAAAYAASQAAAVAPPKEEAPARFPHLPPPAAPGKIVRQEEIKDLGITQVEFENGVRLNLKPADFKKNEIVFTLVFGFGASGEPADKPGLAMLAPAVMNESGFGGIGKEALKRALAGKTTGIGLGVREDAFVFTGSTVPGEMETAFQLLHAGIVDPAFEKDAYTLAMERFRKMYASLTQSVEGQASLYAPSFFASGDSRFGKPPWEVFARLTLEDARAWVGGAIAREPLELSMAGDFAPEEAIRLAALYLGGLPARAGAEGPGRDINVVFPKGKSETRKIATTFDKAIALVAWPGRDIWDIKTTRRMAILAEALDNRLMDVVRQKMGATYSPAAWNEPSRAFPGYGTLKAAVVVAPDKAGIIPGLVRDIAQEMGVQGIGKEDLARAKEPVLTQVRDAVRINGYWLDSVLAGSTRHPEQIAWSREMRADFQSVTLEEINALAARILVRPVSAWFVAMPEEKGK
jgi:zinc protease